MEASFASPGDPAFRTGILILPNFGLAMPGRSTVAQAYSLSPRMGAILGWHFSSWFSLNAELDLKVMTLDAHNALGDHATGFLFDYGLSPFFHVSAPRVEAVIGPKLGRFRYWLNDENYGEPLHGAIGWSYGVNVGLLVPIKSMALGGLVAYTWHHATELCGEPFPHMCRSRYSNDGDFEVVAFSAALLY